MVNDKKNHHRWKDNEILQTIQRMQNQIILQQQHNHPPKIQQQYIYDEMNALFTNINKRTVYQPSIHKKLAVIPR